MGAALKDHTAVCEKKIAYRDNITAWLAAEEHDDFLEPYQCPICHRWHLRGVVKRRRRAQQRRYARRAQAA